MDAQESNGRIRQLRLVVSVPEGEDFESALAFYRDVLGMPQQEAYEGEDDARVVILGAGRATLELSNAAQVRFIDRVEADGVPSATLRVALEVDDSRIRHCLGRRRRSRSHRRAPRDAVAIGELATVRSGRAATHAVRGARPALSTSRHRAFPDRLRIARF